MYGLPVCMTSGLRIYDRPCVTLQICYWLAPCYSSVIPHHSLVAMYKQYRCNHCLLLNLQTHSERQSSYHTRTPVSFANFFWHNLSFSKKFFQSKATTWWNNLPITLISSQQLSFHVYYITVYYIPDCLRNFVMMFLYIVCVVINCYCTWLFLWRGSCIL